LAVVEGLVVERLEDRRLQLRADRLARLGHVVAQAREEAAPLGLGRLGARGLGRVLAGLEELMPGAGHRPAEDRDDRAAGAWSTRSG
jgi:hypothetical protein